MQTYAGTLTHADRDFRSESRSATLIVGAVYQVKTVLARNLGGFVLDLVYCSYAREGCCCD